MNITKLHEVGKLHRQEIERLENEITNARENKKQDLIEFMDNILKNIDKIDGIDATAYENRIELSDDKWGYVSKVEIQSSWGSEDRTYSIETRIQSFNSGDLDQHIACSVAASNIKEITEGVLASYESLVNRHDESIGALYREKRQLNSELNHLIEIEQKKNETVMMDAIKSGFDFTPHITDKGRTKYRLYTGYRDDYEFVTKVDFVKNSGKSVVLVAENVWSTGENHPIEFRIKKEDLFDELYSLLTKETETAPSE